VDGESDLEAVGPNLVKPGADTTHKIVRIWMDAASNWLRYVSVDRVDDLPARVRVTIPRTPTIDNGSAAIVVYMESHGAETLASAIADSGQTEYEKFLGAAADLARITPNTIPLLKRHGRPNSQARSLAKRLKHHPQAPSLADYLAIKDVRKQLALIVERIAQGALPANEDARERAEFWRHKLNELRTPSSHQKFRLRVDQLLSKPRSPETEQEVLDELSRTVRHEEQLVFWHPIQQQTGTDALSTCIRWSGLVAFCERHVTRGNAASSSISIRDALLLDNVDDGRSRPIEVQWAHRLRDDTKRLHDLAMTAGIDVNGRLAITDLLQALEDLLDGKCAEFTALVRRVKPITIVITSWAMQSRRHIADRLYRLLTELRVATSRLLQLIDGSRSIPGLLILDHYFHHEAIGNHGCGPGRPNDIEWRTIANLLTSHAKEAVELWHMEVGTPARSLAHIVTRSGTPVSLAMLEENSYHALVLSAANLLVGGRIRVNRLQGPTPLPSRDAAPSANKARDTLVRQMLSLPAGWPTETARQLQREHADALDQCAPPKPAATGDPIKAAPVGGTSAASDDNAPSLRITASFYRAGDSWHIAYGESEGHVRHNVGFEYIRKLLLSPNTPIDGWKLARNEPVPQLAQQEVVDRETLEDAREAITNLEKRKAEAADHQEVADLEHKAQKLRNYTQAATQARGGKRQPKTERSELERTRDSVGKAIGRALEKIRDVCKPLHDHLSACIHHPTSTHPCYTCSDDAMPVWQLTAKEMTRQTDDD